ncbi:hypothetical protein COB52_01745 [Candidatus Kaiserbacteria bacterium]|nr:MAG: hypothetical protein COB52_01745 [Candidatus Kaiserbacteria bacterium]
MGHVTSIALTKSRLSSRCRVLVNALLIGVVLSGFFYSWKSGHYDYVLIASPQKVFGYVSLNWLELLHKVGFSARQILWGLLVGCPLGYLAAVILSMTRTFSLTVWFFFGMVFAYPKIAFLLFISMANDFDASTIAYFHIWVSFMITFLPTGMLVGNILDGKEKTMSKDLTDALSLKFASQMRLLIWVIFPLSLPALRTGMRLSSLIMWPLLVLSETVVIGGAPGIGRMVFIYGHESYEATEFLVASTAMALCNVITGIFIQIVTDEYGWFLRKVLRKMSSRTRNGSGWFSFSAGLFF